jgi:hypothetical protein
VIKANHLPGEREKRKGGRKENKAMKTQEIAILDFGLGLDDEFSSPDILTDTNNCNCPNNGCIEIVIT